MAENGGVEVECSPTATAAHFANLSTLRLDIEQLFADKAAGVVDSARLGQVSSTLRGGMYELPFWQNTAATKYYRDIGLIAVPPGSHDTLAILYDQTVEEGKADAAAHEAWFQVVNLVWELLPALLLLLVLLVWGAVTWVKDPVATHIWVIGTVAGGLCLALPCFDRQLDRRDKALQLQQASRKLQRLAESTFVLV